MILAQLGLMVGWIVGGRLFTSLFNPLEFFFVLSPIHSICEVQK
jgi:hypothetical protein